MKGRVFKSTGSWYIVYTEKGEILNCRVRGKLRLDGTDTTNPIAVGDFVKIQKEPDSCVIDEVLPRNNYIIRKSVKKKSQAHILAANLDMAALVVTMTLPRTSTGFIDRFLITAEAYDIPQLLIFNKTDLLKSKEEKRMNELIETYQDIGIQCVKTSAQTQDGLRDLDKKLEGKTTLFSGHSGVGKSSILNLLATDIDQEVRDVSSWTEKGQHTTTFAEMFSVNSNTFIIDTPGIKELGLVEMEQEEISGYFPEMRALQSECRFHNCMHLNEPGCAVKRALENNEIAEFRYKSYLSMLEDEDSHR